MRAGSEIRSFAPPPVDRREILRYAGIREATAEISALLEECLRQAEPVLQYRVCCRRFPVIFEEDAIDLGFTRTGSRNLRKNLENCRSLWLFSATVGLGMDRLIARYSRLSPAKGVLMQAIGTERVEALCDAFQGEIAAQEKSIAPRFSPGYGDFPLDCQRDIFAALDCGSIGLTLNSNLFMTPSKSVTAVIGVREG